MMRNVAEWFLGFLQQNQMILVVITVVLAVRLLIQELPKKYSYLLWAVVGLRMVFVNWLPFSLSVFSLLRFLPLTVQNGLSAWGIGGKLFGTGISGAGVGTGTELGLGAAGQTGDVVLKEVGGSSQQFVLEGTNRLDYISDWDIGTSNQALSPFWQKLFFSLFILWIVGMLAILTYGMVSYVRCRRLVKQAVRLEGNVWECDNLPSSFVLGLIKPRIYLPFQLSGEERSYILEHERCHIRRKDSLVKLFAFCLLAVYWINPLVWLSYYLMSQDLEMSCDEAVLKKLGEGIKKAYSTSLLAFATGKRSLTEKRNTIFMPLAFGESHSAKRIKHVLHYRKPKLLGSAAGVLAVVLIAVLCLTNQPEVAAGNSTGESENKKSENGENGENESRDGRNNKNEKNAYGFYRIYPKMLEYMTITYPEYQELTGQEMEFYHGGRYIGSLPDSGVELVMMGSYDEDNAEFSIDETARFIRLQGKLSDFFILPPELEEMPLEEFISKLTEQNGNSLTWESLEGGGTAYYVANFYAAIEFDSDGDGINDVRMDLSLSKENSQGEEEASTMVSPDTAAWLTRILLEYDAENQGIDQNRKGLYQVYPKVLSYMNMTYPEYQEATGREMEDAGSGFFTGSFPGSEIEITMRGRYNSEQKFYIDERAQFIKLQGKLSELISIPQEDFGTLSWDELMNRMWQWEGVLWNNAEVPVSDKAAAYTFSVDYDKDGKGELIIAFFLLNHSLLDKVDPDIKVCMEWGK